MGPNSVAHWSQNWGPHDSRGHNSDRASSYTYRSETECSNAHFTSQRIMLVVLPCTQPMCYNTLSFLWARFLPITFRQSALHPFPVAVIL